MWFRSSGLRRWANVDGNWTIDARAGVLLHNTITTSDGIIEGTSYVYDASGRLVQDFEGAAETVAWNSSQATSNPAFCSDMFVGPAGPTTVRCYASGSRSKTYDAENRLRTETFEFSGAAPTATSYGYAYAGSYWSISNQGQPANLQTVDYGATSHPMRFSLYHPEVATSETRAWLWDGGDRFIECQLANSSCQNPSLSIEGLGDYDLASGSLVRVNDRGRTGGVTMSRSAAVFSGFGDAPTTNPRRPFYAPCSSANTNDVICLPQHDGKLTADGWTLDYETWQGVRTSDLSVGQWNTPDAYAGDVHDPMSQKPFMWNRNNPYDYSDPSGFVPSWDRRWDAQWRAGHDLIPDKTDDHVLLILATRKNGDHYDPHKDPHRERGKRNKHVAQQIFGWPAARQGEDAVQATRDLAHSLGPSSVQQMIEQGVTREDVLSLRSVYRAAIENSKQSDFSLNKARHDYMEKLWHLWPDHRI